jgi:hypothetical protein
VGTEKASALKSITPTETIPITRHYLLRGAPAENERSSPSTPLAKQSSIELFPCDSLRTAYAVAAKQQRYPTAPSSSHATDATDAYTGHTHATEYYAASLCAASDTPAVYHRNGSCHGKKSFARPIVCCSMICLALELRGHLQQPQADAESKQAVHDQSSV